jgi:hypothetical protein
VENALNSISVPSAQVNRLLAQMEPFRTELRSQLACYVHLATLARLVYKKSARPITFVIKLLLQLSHTENYALAVPFQKTQPMVSVQLAIAQNVPPNSFARPVELWVSVQQVIFVSTVQTHINQTSRLMPTLAQVVTTVVKELSNR